ncbi:MAG: glycoside hydrolase family 65 protein, partial [Gammaproteobacteria bacterium]|nr:glycoside hydrolase family 65 protein [Gammaproteobacteria bacterium]
MDKTWTLSYNGYKPEQEGLRETLCALGNGYFCTRGAATDASADEVHYPGTYLVGGYNRLTTEIKGHEVENEDLVNMPNWLVLEISIDNGPWLHPDELEFLDYNQHLDVANGMLIRSLRFRDNNGRTTRWQERRLVSMADQHLAGLEIEIEPEDWSGELGIRSALDGTVINAGVARYRELNSRHLETLDSGQSEDDSIWLMSRTVQSRIEIAEAARTRIFSQNEQLTVPHHTDTQPDFIAQEFRLHVEARQSLSVEKIVALFTSLDHAVSEPEVMAQQRLTEVDNFQDLADRHSVAWKHLWEKFDLCLDIQDGNNDQLKLRLHIFHLLQTVSRHTIDRDVGVPPRGWHGEAYRAHIMWDELFIFPFLNLRHPVLTRALLRYRYRRLPAARQLAREAGFRGAMFPWQSGSSGREESQKLHLNPQSGRWIPDNSNRQRHISSAVAYNVWQYYQVTDDHEFLYDYGAEMLVEIARF